MFDIGATELLVLAVVAIIVVGPKDLPRLLRQVGQWIAKARSMAREFQSHFDEAARETGLDDIRKDILEMDKGAPLGDLAEPFDDIAKSIEEPAPAKKKPAGTGSRATRDQPRANERAGASEPPAKPRNKPAARKPGRAGARRISGK